MARPPSFPVPSPLRVALGRTRAPALAAPLLGLLVLGAGGCPIVAVVDDPPDPCLDVVCGDHEYCSEGECFCASGYVPDEVEGCLAVQDLLLTDACADGMDTQWRIWASDGGWVWPGGDGVFVTIGLNFISEESIACRDGEELCLGASTDQFDWGVGLDGDLSCSDCCWTCAPGTVDLGVLECN